MARTLLEPHGSLPPLHPQALTHCPTAVSGVPDSLKAILGAEFRRRPVLRLPTRARRPLSSGDCGGIEPEVDGTVLAQWQVPATVLTGGLAAALLSDLSGGVSHPTLQIASDLAFLASMAGAIEALVTAGRVVPALRGGGVPGKLDWTLSPESGIRQWQAQLVSVLPPVLRTAGHRGAQVVDDVCGVVSNALVQQRLQECTALGETVLNGTVPNRWMTGHRGVVDELGPWRESVNSPISSLVLRLVDPVEPTNPQGAIWTLEVCTQVPGHDPVRASTLEPNDQLREHLRTVLAIAERAFPPLKAAALAPDGLDRELSDVEAIELVGTGAGKLRAEGIAVLVPREWTRMTPSLALRVESPKFDEGSGLLGLAAIVDCRWSMALGDTTLSERELEELAQSSGSLVRLRGEWVHVDGESSRRAARYVRRHHGAQSTIGRVLGELAAGDVPPVPVAGVTATGWASDLFGGTTTQQLRRVRQPRTLRGELRPYQRRGLDWMAFMSRVGLGVVLADDMGLGKTIQLLSLLLHERARKNGPTLLVSPMSVVGNWQREAEKFAPTLRLYVHHGSSRSRGDGLRQRHASVDLIITTYALLARDVHQLAELPWDRIVLDEAQHVKNSTTAVAKAVRAIPARHRIAMTGTPVENRLDELRSILDFANPGILGSAEAFRTRFAQPIEKDRNPEAIATLKLLTAPFVLRRVKTDPTVISDLPDKIEMTVQANLTMEQAGLYKAVVADMLEKIETLSGLARSRLVMATLVKLKQVCNHPAQYLHDGSAAMRHGQHRSGKLELVEDIIDTVVADGERALLFTQFRQFGDIVVPHLTKRLGAEVPFLHGGVVRNKRDQMVAQFQADDGPSVMVLSLKAGGSGLNLTAANHVVHMDRWWNPAVENQATDRAFRIGQQRNVQVRKFVCVGTVEERIDQLMVGKQQLADLVVGAGEGWVSTLDTSRLRELLMLGAEAVGQ